MNSTQTFRPLVSAIVSVYRAERFIRGCLEDLVGQTLFQKGQLEIIVINSGSHENEGTITEEYTARYPSRVRYIRTEERETIYRAWNRGIEAAGGTYVTNANADDRHRPDGLEVMTTCLDRNPEIALVYADCDVTTVENGRFGETPIVARFKWPDFDPVQLFRICYIGPQPMWRRSLHRRHGLFDPTCRSAGDYEFWLRLAAAGERFLHIPETLGLYLQSPGGVEHANQRLSWEESSRARTKHWPMSWGTLPSPSGNYLFPVSASRQNGSSPLVSVIIPTRNRPEFLARAIQSVLNQTYKNIEIIVINDGGIDVGELTAHFNSRRNIRYINLPTGIERSAARNLGIRAAHGIYIAYLDDDDRYLPEHVATLVRHAQETGCRVVYSDAYRVELDPSTGLPDETRRDIPYSLDFDPVRLHVENYIPILCLMHERSCLDETGMFDEQLSRLEDWDLWLRLSRVARFHHIPQATCEFTWHHGGSSQTLNNAPLFLNAYKTICKKHPGAARENASIRLWQQSNIFVKTCQTFEYLKQLLEPSCRGNRALPSISPETIGTLLTHGIDSKRLESTLCWTKSFFEDENLIESWLDRALTADEENHPARMRLVTLLMRQKRTLTALAHLEILHLHHPTDIPIISELASLYANSMGNRQKTADILNKGLWLYPGNETLRDQLKKILNR